MATEKQRAAARRNIKKAQAARRNIKKAQAATAAKRAIAHPPKKATTSQSVGDDVVARPSAPNEAHRSDLGSVDELIRRLAAERQGAALAPKVKEAQAVDAKRIIASKSTETKNALLSGRDLAAARGALERAPLLGIGLVVALVLLSAVLFILARGPTVPAGGRTVPTVSPGVRAVIVVTAIPSHLNAGESAPGSTRTAPARPFATATAGIRERIPLRTETLVAQSWRDVAGTVRVHIVASAANDTSDVLSLATAERTFRIISADGQTLYSGRFAYAFPFVLLPGGTSHLITTVVLPVGADSTDLRIEIGLLAVVTTAVQPMLEVSDLSLVSSDGRPGVRGIVRNTGVDDVTSGVVAVIGRDASGRVIGGFYDNVNVASIAAGGEALFHTEYPGLPPAVAGRIADLSGVAFDVETGIPR